MSLLVDLAVRWKKKLSWNVQYWLGRWNHLNSPLEEPRFDKVLELMTRHVPRGSSILEIACGEGLFYKKIDPAFYRRYLGIDLSLLAIKKATLLKKSRAEFVRADFLARDMETFRPKEKFDVIIFHECIYYSAYPEKVFRKYLQYLTPGGKIILSVYEMDFTMAALHNLEQKFFFQDRILVENEIGKWHLLLHDPAVAS